ncbi:MAG TPA: sialidase family protein [Terriglobales bacterium]|nr:sialidase family protein [Terriglobales bacterium]
MTNQAMRLLLPLPSHFRLMLMPFVALFLCLLAVPAVAQISPASSDLPAAPGARVIKLTPRPGQFTEPSIAVNPTNPRQLVGAFQNTAVAYSRDAGQTWTLADDVAPPDYKVSGDVSVIYDNQGHAFLCYIAFDKLGTENYWAHGATRNGIFVRRSLDGGQAWDKDASIVIAHPSDPGIPFEDKPYIVADATHSKYAGNLYIGWTEFSLDKSILLFSRSSDTGKTWSKPIEISTREGLPRDDNGAVEGFTGAVASDGTLYVVWCDISGIVMAVSKDGGASFSHSRTIIKTGPSYFDPTSVGRGNGFPQIAIDPRNSQLFVTWGDFTNGDLDIFSATSKDHGKHWSQPVRVNDDPLHNGRDQFFQWLAVDPIDGSESIIFCDRRADPGNRSYYMTLARSTDRGQTFKNYVWSTEPSDPKDVFMGDYMGIAAYGGKVYGIWARTATPEEQPPASDRLSEPKKNDASNIQAEGEKPVPTLKPKGLFVEVGVADFSAQPAKPQ